MTDASWETLSNQAIAAAGVVYFLALLAHLVEWSSLRKVPVGRPRRSRWPPVAWPRHRSRPPRPSVRARDDEGRVAMFGRLGVLLTVIAVAVHFVALVARGAAADPNRVPWGNMYEFTITGTFMVALGYVVLVRRFAWRWLAPIVLTVVVSLLMVAVIWLYDPVAPLTEALFSPWLVIHVVSAILATAAFTLGGMLSVLYLLKDAPPRHHHRLPRPGAGARRPGPDGLPAARVRVPGVDLRGADHRADLGRTRRGRRTGTGTPRRSGRSSPGSSTRRTSTRATTAGWKGRNAAILALVGTATLWFNFIGINYFSTTSQHSYAGAAVVGSPEPGQASGSS